MATRDEKEILSALKSLVKGVSFKSPASRLSAVYADPDDLVKTVNVQTPFVTVGLNEETDISFSGFTKTARKQTVTCFIRGYLRAGHPIPQTAEYSNLRIEARQAIKQIHDAIIVNPKMGVAISQVININARMVYLSFQDDPYTGFEIEFELTHNIGA